MQIQNSSDFFVCLSVCYLAYFLTEIIQILGYLQIWIRYLSEIFWRHSWDVGTLVPNNSEFFVCLSVCYLAHFLTEITQILRYIQIWIRYLSEFFGDIPWMFVHLFQIILNFLYVCQSVSWLISLGKSYKYRDISSSGRDIFLKFSETFWYVCTLFPN